MQRSASVPAYGATGGSIGGSSELSDDWPVSVGMLREARRRREHDAQTLANRIALLRQEGEKAVKRLADTKVRTRELEMRPLKTAENEVFLLARLGEIQRQQRKNQINRESGRASRQTAQQALIDRRRQHAAEMRDHAKQAQDAKKADDAAKRRLVLERAAVLKERAVGEEKYRRLYEARMAQFQKHREERQAQGALEVALKASTDQRISEMECEEAELLEWLEAKQLEQREAYDALGAVADSRRGHLPSLTTSGLRKAEG